MTYGYAPNNQRIWKGDGSATDEFVFYSVGGQKLATYTLSAWQEYPSYSLNTQPYLKAGVQYYYSYFGGRLVGKTTSYIYWGPIPTDARGSVGNYFPYGDEKPSATTNNTENSQRTTGIPRAGWIMLRIGITSRGRGDFCRRTRIKRQVARAIRGVGIDMRIPKVTL